MDFVLPQEGFDLALVTLHDAVQPDAEGLFGRRGTRAPAPKHRIALRAFQTKAERHHKLARADRGEGKKLSPIVIPPPEIAAERHSEVSLNRVIWRAVPGLIWPVWRNQSSQTS